MRLLSLNVNRASAARAVLQVAAVATYTPDIVALHEVGTGQIGVYRTALAAAGLSFVVDSVGAVPPPPAETKRRAAVIVASRWACAAVDGLPARVPWRERAVSAVVDSPWGAVTVHCVYVPVGTSDKAAKHGTMRGMYDALAVPHAGHRILCGDFNSPQEEYPDGTIRPFGRGEMAQAEHDVLRGLAAHDLPDLYRAVNGYPAHEGSWYSPQRNNGFRLDHIFASRSLGGRECGYLHAFRAVPPEGGQRLSDHAAMLAVFAPEG